MYNLAVGSSNVYMHIMIKEARAYSRGWRGRVLGVGLTGWEWGVVVVGCWAWAPAEIFVMGGGGGGASQKKAPTMQKKVAIKKAPT